MALPVIGARIELLAKSNIRFQGTLHDINHAESSISLENVKSFGTEGRSGNPNTEILAQEGLFSLIVFKGSDVKDLKVLPTVEQTWFPPTSYLYNNDQNMNYQMNQQAYWQQSPPRYINQFGQFQQTGSPATRSAVQPNYNPVEYIRNDSRLDRTDNKSDDSKKLENNLAYTSNSVISGENSKIQFGAISSKLDTLNKSHQEISIDQKKGALQVSQSLNNTFPVEANDRKREKPRNKSQAPNEILNQKDRQNNQSDQFKSNASQQRPSNQVNQNSNRLPKKMIEIPKEDFDFESTKEFRKEELEIILPKYNKASFFDDISNEQKDRQESNDWKGKRGEEKKQNLETFGQTGIRHRGRGKGRGRGGNRGKGRGRGGSNNDNGLSQQ